MKRKDYEDKYDDFSSIYLSSPSAKSRRLDPDLLPLTNEDPISSGISDSEVVEPLTSSPTTDDLGLGSRPPSGGGGDCCNEKALVLYSPTNTLFFKSPTSPDFSVVVNADLIPGLRDQFILLGNSNMVRPMKDALIAKDKITDISDDRLAVVPWVGTRAGPQAAGMSATMEAEEVEMMDTDDDSGGSGTAAIPAGGAAGGAGGLQQWQREHFLRPELVQNTCTPVTW